MGSGNTSTPRNARDESFRNLIDNSPDGIFVHGGGMVVYANQARAELMGYESAGELMGRPLTDFVDPIDRNAVVGRVRELEQGDAKVSRAEGLLRRKDGSAVNVEVAATLTVFNGQPVVLTIARELAERRQLTAHIAQRERLAAVGSVAAGVGHEINNPLAYVILSLGLALEKLEAGSQDLREIADLIKEARSGADRIKRLAQDLRRFSRPPDDDLVSVPLADAVVPAIRMAQHEIRQRARLEQAELPQLYVHGNASRLEQVFLNLLINATQAIEPGYAGENSVAIGATQEDGWVVVSVQDTGSGISPRSLEKIFDPFYSTKPRDQGIGLGLSICRDILQQCGGEITVSSCVGAGTRVEVRLRVAMG